MKLPLRVLSTAVLALAALAAHAETYALMVGINDYPDVVDANGKPIKDENGNIVDSDLKGCVNDIKNYNDLLVNKYGVKPANVRLVLDKQANEDGFVGGVKWLLANAKAGDQIFFVYSGHGTQFDDEDAKEDDGKQEGIVLADEKIVTGAFFHEVSQMAAKGGVNATFVFDSCFSGGVTRDVASFDGNAATRRKRSIEAGYLRGTKAISLANRESIIRIPKAAPAQAGGSYMFLMAGREDQPTDDLEFKDNSMPPRGLFSLVFGMFLEDNLYASVESVMNATVKLLKDKGFEQVPQMEFSSEDRAKRPFFLK